MNSLFDIINIPFSYVIRFFDSFTGSYALTLLLFALIIKLVFLPMGIKQQKNQIKMAALRPKEEVIRKKYAGRTDRATQQKMQQEIMELQQKENVSPLGGCLPLIIQMIVIVALYQIIRNPLTYICGIGIEGLEAIKAALPEITMQGEQIGAISAINGLATSNPTAYASLLEQVPGIANIPNFSLFGMDLTVVPWNTFPSVHMIIPIVCFVLQFVTMKLTRKFTYQSPAAEATQDNISMKIMDFAMPLMSLYFCFILQGAIGLYWIYQNIFSFAQTVILAKTMPVPRYTEEDIKKAEKEMKAKGYNTKKADLPRVRSLHHIDDDDYETLPEVESKESKGAAQPLLNGEKVPLKDENAKKKKKND